jgi:hypothetical protein
MWDSNGDIDHAALVEVVDSGDMHVSGRIDGSSRVILRSTGGSITVDGRIDGSSIVYLVTSGGSITINGKIDGSSTVILVSTTSTVTITGKVDGSSNITVQAAGDIAVGTTGGGDDKKIDGSSSVTLRSTTGSITVGSRIDGSSVVDFVTSRGRVTVGDRIDGSSYVRALALVDVNIGDKIDGSSRVELVSNRGSVTVNGKIDGSSSALLSAGRDVVIGNGGGEDHKIDGNCSVTAIANGDIRLGSRIAKDRTTVDFAAGGTVTIGGEIGYNASVRLLSSAGKITVGGGVNGGGTHLITWPKGAANPSVSGGAQWDEQEWAVPAALAPNAKRSGYWWENWPQTFGYVAPFRAVPRSLDDLVAAVIGSGTPDRPDLTPVKAVGGGWSFTDAALPMASVAEVDQASTVKKGTWQRQDLRSVLQGLNDSYPTAIDVLPEAVDRAAGSFTAYDQAKLRQVTPSGVQLPASPHVRLIDTRSLASSLQCEFEAIRAARARENQEILFHVEAGITMADLQQLLDHQHPRLAVRASGGSPGATLAGALATATHGGEFSWPLLTDSVRAVHLVGPGGEQWWIEGDIPVADQLKLQQRYPKIDPAHFIGNGWNGIPGLSAQDVLDAVVVSMGAAGVIYSMVLHVVPQFGLRQIVHPTTWSELLTTAHMSEPELRAGKGAANKSVLDALMNGALNGTGIPMAKNVYVDLAINPLNRDCWIVNRELTPSLPDDANSPSAGVGDYVTALSRALSQHSTDALQGSVLGGRIFDFFSWGANLLGLFHDPAKISGLLGFVLGSGEPLGTLLAAVSAQAVVNVNNQSGNPDRGQQFLGDMLSGVLHALEGTEPGQNSDSTAVSHQVGAIGWPARGIPGRALEIALAPESAFTFLQTVLFDDVLANTMTAANQPLIGYISVRVCPSTRTLMGMQQYAPYSVMIEVVAYRSPEANHVMDMIQSKAVQWKGPGPRPLLHWGLENDLVNHAFLAGTPLGLPYKGGMSRLDAFKKIRDFLRHSHAPVFDNAFTKRIGV